MTVEVYRELLLGVGHSRERRMQPPGTFARWQNLFTLDHNESLDPDFICNLNITPWPVAVGSEHAQDARITRPHMNMPGAGMGASEFAEDSFNEIHAYEVLEHLRAQGNARGFFADFSEIWRVLKPQGYLCATCPSRYSGWLWGDPSHTRAILPESLTFLDQSEYVKQLDGARPSSMSDFRNIYTADFKCVEQAVNRDQFMFILQAVKPSRWARPKARE